MLSENLQELLSAYVDGELSPAEYERVMSALRDSAIARDYVAQLRGLSQQLKILPAETCPTQVTTRFLQNAKRKQIRTRNRRLAYVASLAAAILLSIGTWWYLNQQPGPVIVPVLNNNNLALNNNNSNNKAIPPVISTEPVTPPKQYPDATLYAQFVQETLATAYDQLNNWQDRLNNSVTWLAQADALREGRFLESQATLLTGPFKTTAAGFKTIDTPLPLLQTPAEFNINALQNRWSRKGLFVLDLASRNTVNTLSYLIDAAQQTKVPLVIDDEVKQRLTKKLPTTFMVYLENLTEEQATAWLKAMEANDHWQSRTDATCQSMLLYALRETDLPLIARSLGLPPEQLTRPASTTNGLALSYYSYRLPTSLSDNARKTAASFQGPAKDRLSLVVMIRAGK